MAILLMSWLALKWSWRREAATREGATTSASTNLLVLCQTPPADSLVTGHALFDLAGPSSGTL